MNERLAPRDFGNVLVVDDDPILCELLVAELEEAGFRASSVSDLDSLRAKVRERFYDLILLDLFLGEVDSLEALPFLARETPYTKIIMMSAHGTVEMAVDAMEKGATTFVCKSKDARSMVDALKDRLGTQMRQEGAPLADRAGIIGESQAIREVMTRIDQFKDVDSTVLLEGESGTGKELVARALHGLSTRSEGRFEAVNCGAIPENLLESELFGHRRGAFTDAKTDRKGLFEICDGGTLFLDEIGEMPLSLQVKILRVLQEREVMPIGANRAIPINTRVVAATNRNLAGEVEKGRFRQDLYYRLAVLQISLPSLRERRSDIPLLVENFIQKFSRRFKKDLVPLTKELETRLTAYDWPGNIRELQNAVERGVVLSKDGKLRMEDMLTSFARPETKSDTPIDEQGEYWMQPLSEAKKGFEKAYLQHLLEVTRGNISEMARISGRYRADIYRLLTKYEVQWEEFRE